MLPADLARAAGISKGYLSSVLNGSKPEPSVRMAAKFSKVLGCDPMWLQTGRGTARFLEEEVDSAAPPESASSMVREEPAVPVPQRDPMVRIAAALERIAAAMEAAQSLPQRQTNCEPEAKR